MIRGQHECRTDELGPSSVERESLGDLNVDRGGARRRRIDHERRHRSEKHAAAYSQRFRWSPDRGRLVVGRRREVGKEVVGGSLHGGRREGGSVVGKGQGGGRLPQQRGGLLQACGRRQRHRVLSPVDEAAAVDRCDRRIR